MQDDAETRAATRVAEQALMAMQSRGIPPTPDNFTVWYLHHAGGNSALSRAVARLDASPTGIGAAECAGLHRSFCASGDDFREIKQVSERVGELVDEVSRRLGVASSETRDYSARLTSLGNGLSAAIDPSELLAVVRELEHQTELMSQRAGSLQSELERSSREVESLKGDLASARQAASTDALTGLGNRKHFDDVFSHEAEEAAGSGEPLAVLVADIDHFKLFNDTHGHQVGDAVLRLVAERLRRSVKGRDTVARYGGEEFVILLPRTALADATAVADQLRSEIANSRLVVRNRKQDLGKVTLSIGVALYRPGETPDNCFRRADEALYAAKRGGRNRVVAETMLESAAA